MNRRESGHAGDSALERLIVMAAMGAIALLSVFPVRSNDIWWHLAVGRQLVETGRFIYVDPFSFATLGSPWVPHAWLSGVLLYLVHAFAGAVGLVVTRSVLIAAIFGCLLGLTRRLGVSVFVFIPAVLLVALNAHSRFLLRPHLFEYLLLVVLLAHLVTQRTAAGRRFLVVPLVIQVLWTNMHASFYFGVAVVSLFYAGEWLSHRVSTAHGFLPRDFHWRRAVFLVLLMTAASFVNPSPVPFVLQPLDAEHVGLLRQFTSEWKSPFDSALRLAPFHPYYEILLAMSLFAFLVGWGRLRLSSLLIVGFFALLSIGAHRFRVEFSLVALPLILEQIASSQRIGMLRRALSQPRRRLRVGRVLSVLVTVLVIFAARDRIEIAGAVSDRFPDQALEFLIENDVGHRPFHSIGFGSYLVWKLGPDRKSFIDGRNFDRSVYRDFLSAQIEETGFSRVVQKYEIDALVLPAVGRSDFGMRNVHGYAARSDLWSLVHVDRHAFVYVNNASVPPAWLANHTYRLYHPMTFRDLRFPKRSLDILVSELDRARRADPKYIQPLLDAALFFEATGDTTRAVDALNEAIEISDSPTPLRERLRRIRGIGLGAAE